MGVRVGRPAVAGCLAGVVALTGCPAPGGQREHLRENLVGRTWVARKGTTYQACAFRPDGTAAVTFRAADGPFVVPARFAVVNFDTGYDSHALEFEFAPADDHRRAYRVAFGEEMPATRRHSVRLFKGYLLIFDGNKDEAGGMAEFTTAREGER